MGRNYYCEYCENRMKNDLNVRKKHNEGLPHKINKANYLATIKEPEIIYEEESKKLPCSRFLNGRECSFGLFCNFRHYTQEQLDELRQIAYKKTMKKQQQINSMAELNSTARENEESYEKATFAWSYPEEKIKGLVLPPSLRPLKVSDTLDFAEWG